MSLASTNFFPYYPALKSGVVVLVYLSTRLPSSTAIRSFGVVIIIWASVSKRISFFIFISPSWRGVVQFPPPPPPSEREDFSVWHSASGVCESEVMYFILLFVFEMSEYYVFPVPITLLGLYLV